jgi:hypothetical protein
MREIRTLRATWRGLETWNGRDTSADRRASPRPYLRERGAAMSRATHLPEGLRLTGGGAEWDRRVAELL